MIETRRKVSTAGLEGEPGAQVGASCRLKGEGTSWRSKLSSSCLAPRRRVLVPLLAPNRAPLRLLGESQRPGRGPQTREARCVGFALETSRMTSRKPVRCGQRPAD